MESTSTGLIAGIMAARYVLGLDLSAPFKTTVTGGLLSYITDLSVKKFQPMNANFGILPSLEKRAPKKIRKKLYGERALADIDSWKKSL